MSSTRLATGEPGTRARARRPPSRWPLRRRGTLTALAALLIVLALTIGALISWSFSSEVLSPGDLSPPADVTVLGTSSGQVILARSHAATLPGLYGIGWHDGHAVIGAVLATDKKTVTRALSAVRGRLTAGTHVAFDDVYTGNPAQALGLPFSEAQVHGELGAMPAWLIPGRGSTWAIVVHGLDGDREGDMGFVAPLHRAGLPALLITYREDAGAPASPDGLHHMGLTEWRDLQAAAHYALAHGARRLVLLGASMITRKAFTCRSCCSTAPPTSSCRSPRAGRSRAS